MTYTSNRSPTDYVPTVYDNYTVHSKVCFFRPIRSIH
jgi:hypothetical protein